MNLVSTVKHREFEVSLQPNRAVETRLLITKRKGNIIFWLSFVGILCKTLFKYRLPLAPILFLGPFKK